MKNISSILIFHKTYLSIFPFIDIDIFTNVHIDNDTHIFKNDHLSISIFSRITFSIFSQSVNISTINMSKDIMSYTYIPAHGPEYAILVGYYYYLLVICDAWVTSCDSHGLRSSSYGPLDFQYKYYAGVCNTHRHCVCVSVWLCVLFVLCVCVSVSVWHMN